MNRQSTLLSIIGHVVLGAIIILWGIQWPFQAREISIDTVEIIDNASFDALVAQANIDQSDAINPEPAPSPLTAENILPEEEVVPLEDAQPEAEIAPISEEPIEIEIIQARPPEPVEPTPAPAPVVPAIGEAAPRVAIAPPARGAIEVVEQAENTQEDEIAELVETIVEQPAVTPPNRDEIGDAIEAALGELGGDEAVVADVSFAPETAIAPPVRAATSLNTADIETLAPDVTLDTGTATQEVAEADSTPQPSPEVAPTAPAAPIVSAPPQPPARNAASLNIVENAVVAAEEIVDDVEDLVAQVVAETVETQAAEPAPEPDPTPSAPPIGATAPQSATAPPARTSGLNIVSNTQAADAILAELEGTGTQSNSGRDLSRIETGSIIQEIARNWSIAPIADKSNLVELIVVVGFGVDAKGELNSPIELKSPTNPNDDQRAAFQTAERAILNTMPLQLPSDVNPDGVKWTLTFDPSTQSVGLA